MDENSNPKPLTASLPTIRNVSILYTVVVILFLFVGSRVQHREFYSGILITEFLLIAAPALIMLFLFKYDVKEVLRLNGIKLSNLFIIAAIMLFAIPVVGVFNMVNLSLVKLIFGKVIVNQPPVAENSLGLLVNILVIGGSAGICEEIMFRGVIQRSFERLGVAKAILITSFLFSLMHVDFQKFLGIFMLGGLIGYIVYRTNSLYAGIFAHFCNNSFAVVIAYASNKLLDFMKDSGIDTGKAYSSGTEFSSIFEMPAPQLVAVIVVWGVIFLFCAAVLGVLLFALIRNTENKAQEIQKEGKNRAFASIASLAPSVLLIAFIYFAQGLALKGIKVEAIDSILRFIGAK